MISELSILFVEDLPTDVELIKREIRKSGIEFRDRVVDAEEDFIDAIHTFTPDLILSDYSLPSFDGMRALKIQQELAPLIPFVLVTGSVNEETAVECMKAGADDYVIKHNLKRLSAAIQGAIEKKQLIAEKKQVESTLRKSEEMYRSLFENSAIPIFEEDFSQVKELFDELRASGVTDFRAYFDKHPEDIVKCTSLISISNVNSESVQFFQAKDKQEIFNDLSACFMDETWPIFKEEIIALAEGKQYFECEIQVATFEWEHRHLILKLSVRPDCIETLKHVLVSFVDISAYKVAEANLAESEELFRTSFENATVGVGLINASGDFLSVNNALCNLLGYTKEELMALTFSDITFEEDKELGVLNMKQMLAGTLSMSNFEKRYIHKNKSIIWANVSTGIVHSSNRRIEYFVTYIEDITERKLAELTIRKSADLYCALTENMKEVIWILDPVTLRFRYISPSAQKMVGFTPEEIMAFPMQKMVDPQYSEKLVLDLQKIIDDTSSGREKPGTYHTQVIKQPCKDGSYIWAEITAYAFANDETGKLELRGVHRDVTEHRNAEERLSKSEEKFRLLFENAADPIQLLDENLHFIDCNKATIKILAAEDKKQILNCYPADLSPEFQPDEKKSLDKSIALVREAFEKGNFQFEWVHKRFNGELFTVDINLSKVLMDGRNVLLVHWRDITERKQVEAALQKSEEKFRLLAENASDVIWTMDISGRNTYISPSVERLRGFTSQEALLQTEEESLMPDSAKKAKEFITKAINQIEKGERFDSYCLILEQPCKDKSTVWVEVTVSGIFDDSGKFLSFLGVSRNITDRKAAEAALQESQEQYRMLIENQGEGAGIVDLNEIFVFANPAAEQIFDVPPGMLVNRNLKDFILPDEITKIQNESEIRLKGIKSTYEIGIITQKGEKRHLLVTATPQYNFEGLATGTFGVFRDITERKIAEEQLREKQFWLTESQRVGRIGSYSFEINNDKWSSSAVLNEILGMEVNSERTLESWSSIIDSSQREEMQNYFLNEVLTNKQKFNREYKIRRVNDGVERWVLGLGELIFDNEGNPVKMIGTIQDITERKKSEEALIKAKEKAEENDRLKTAFLNNISHEIRTPMNAIIGFSGFLNEPNLLPDKRKYFTDIICNASNQLLSIISDIINIATIETGQESVNNASFNLNTTLRDLYKQFEVKAHNQKLKLNCLTPLPDEETIIDTDETKLVQILSNLIGNSLKFTKVGEVDFGYSVKDNFLEFYVKDTGIGVPQKMHEEIFERFRQADSTIARQFGGTGLGLSISKAYVELLGGKIWLTSEQGQGSVFYFTLPFEVKRNGHSNNSANNLKGLFSLERPRNILVAEDEDFNYMLLEQIFSDLNVQLIRVLNGAEAVMSCKTNPDIDIVIMDVKMPVMDGYDATRLIKQERPDLPVMIQTAYARESDRVKAFECGCDEYVSKPLIINDFLALLEKYLSAKSLA
jgi:PAS domain S-box-containing protein